MKTKNNSFLVQNNKVPINMKKKGEVSAHFQEDKCALRMLNEFTF